MAIFEINWGALSNEKWCVGFQCTEAISELFALDLYLVVKEDSEIDVEGLLLTRASLDVQFSETLGEEPLTFAGTVTSMDLLRMEKNLSLYRVRVSPQLWLLTQSVHSRLWTDKTLNDVVTEVLQDSGLTEGEDFELRIKSKPPKEEHICQYKESNFAFLSRWFEREGWYYFFEHEDGKDKLVVTDDMGSHAPMRSTPVPYVPQSGPDGSARDAFDSVAQRARLSAQTVRINDYDYAKPGTDARGKSEVSQQGFGEITTYGYRLFNQAEAQRLSKIRAEELKAGEDVLRARGAAMRLRAGYLFDLSMHPRNELNTTYLLTRSVHAGYQPSLAGSWGKLVPKPSAGQPTDGDVYRVEVSFLSAETQFRAPSRTPWPGLDSFENAVVDGPSTSQYAQIDDQGRYKAKFKFDEGSLRDGKATTWLRMAQPHGGSVEGFHLPLRKGTEVICSFLAGDPDRPVIIGVVPNAVTPSTVTSANNTQNVIQTGSKNWIVAEDKKDNEWISIYSPAGTLNSNLYLGPPRPEGSFAYTAQTGPGISEEGRNKKELGDYCIQLRTDGSGEAAAGGNINIIAGGDVQIRANAGEFHWFCQGLWFRDVGGNAYETYTKTLTQTVTGAADYQYENTLDVTITGPTKINEGSTVNMTATGAATHDYKQNLSQLVLGNSTEKMLALHDEKITAAGHQSTILGNETITINGAATYDLTANQKVSVMGNKTETVNGSYTFNAKDVTLKIAGNYSKGAPSWHKTIMNTQEETVMGAKIGVVLGGHFEFGIGAKVQRSNTLMIEVNAIKATLTGAVLQGAMVSVSLQGLKISNIGLKSEAVPISISIGTIQSDIQGISATT